MRTLVIAEQANGTLKTGSLCAIAAGASLGQDIDVLLITGADHAAAEQAALTTGVSRVLLCQTEHALADNLIPLISDLVSKGYSHALADASSLGRSVLPGVAASLDVGMLSDVTEIVSADTFLRPIYAGNAIARMQSLDTIKILTTRASAFSPAGLTAQPCEVVAFDVAQAAANVRFVDERISVSARPDLANARVVVSGGRGMQNKDNFALIERVADKLGAAVGASRAAVDAGFAANDLQVGQTGKIVAPELYIAVGISGAIQHLAGMSGSKVIVAINQDAEAPIAQVADYMLVADLFEALPELESVL
jgi:electron transfer flavoprotein alpha subunit